MHGHPVRRAWNVLARGHVALYRLTVGRNRHDVTAHVASAEEKASLWPRLVAHNPEWGGYAERTTRDIPVIVLRPV